MIRAIAALITSVALLAVAGPAASTTAAPTPDGPTPSPEAPLTVIPKDERDITARLMAFTPAALTPSTRLNVSATATNSSTTPVDDVVLELGLTEQPLADRDALEDFLDDPGSFPTRLAAQQPEPPAATDAEPTSTTVARSAAELAGEVEPEPLGPPLAPEASRALTIDASPAELGLPSGDWGVYGAVLTLRTSAGDITVDAVPLTWAGAPVPSLQLSVLTQATGSDARIESLLGSSNVPGVATVVDPTRISNSLAFDTGLVEREIWRVPGGRPDLTSLAHAGDASLVDFSLSLPAGTNIASIGSAPWLSVPASLDESTVQAASELGATAVLAVPEAAGYADLAAAADAPVARLGDTRLLVPDARFSAVIAQYRPGTVAAQARAVAESALLAQEAGGNPVLVALGDGWHPASPQPSPVLEALMSAPWVEPLSVRQLLDEDAVSVELPRTLGTELDLSPAHIDDMAQALADLRVLSRASTSPSAALADWGGDLLQSITTPLRQTPGARDAAVAAALARAEATHDALRIAESSDLNLLAETGEIPITVVNGLDHDVTVRVDLSSLSANLQVLEAPTITVPAGEEHAALVSVEAVSNANVQVSAVLRNADGAPVSEGQAFAVRVRADWGNVATAVFSVLLVLLMVAGVVRTARRGRKDTRAEPAPAPDLAPDADTENVDIDEPDPADETDDGHEPEKGDDTASAGGVEPGSDAESGDEHADGPSRD